MSFFVLDTAGDQKLLKQESYKAAKLDKNGRWLLKDEQPAKICVEEDGNDSENDDDDFFGLPPPSVDLSKIIESTLMETVPRISKAEEDMTHVRQLVDAASENAQRRPKSKRKSVIELDTSDFNVLTGKFDNEQLLKTNVEKELAKVQLPNGFEQVKELPCLPKRDQRKLDRIERSKTKGAGWYNLPATEITYEIKNDLKILQMRSVLDPKRFYKKNDLKVLPKYFQMGTVQHSPLDYYSERHERKNKKRSLVDELLADAEAQKYTKRKYNEVMAQRKDKYTHRKAMKKMKKLKKKK